MTTEDDDDDPLAKKLLPWLAMGSREIENVESRSITVDYTWWWGWWGGAKGQAVGIGDDRNTHLVRHENERFFEF